MESNRFASNLTSITNAFDAWNKADKGFHVPFRTCPADIRASECVPSIFANFSESVVTTYAGQSEVALQMEALSWTSSKKLQEIILAFGRRSIQDPVTIGLGSSNLSSEMENINPITDQDVLAIIDELSKLINTINVFRKGLNTIMGTHKSLEEPGKSLLDTIDNQVIEIVQNLLTYKFSNKIEDDQQIKLMKVLAVRAPEELARNIQKFNISDRDRLFEILTIANNSPHLIDQKVILIEMAKLLFAGKAFYTLNRINNFKIKDQNLLFEIAKLCAQRDAEGTAQMINRFGIVDSNQLFEIAKLCAQKDADVILELMDNFGIVDSNQRFEIAKCCAQQNGYGTAAQIKKFGIVDLNQLFEIAKLCAQQNGFGTARNIKNFSLEDSNQLFEIAKLCAQENGNGMAKHINNFSLEDKNQLFEIAKLCAQENGNGMAQHIKNFSLEDKNQLFEIAKLCAQQNGRTAEYITNFRIRDTNQRAEIAKLCAQQNGYLTAQHIEQFGIGDTNQLFEIAKLCVKNKGFDVAKYINNFYIVDPSQLIEIANLCIQHAFQQGSFEIERLDTIGSLEYAFKKVNIFNYFKINRNNPQPDELKIILTALESCAKSKFLDSLFGTVIKDIEEISDPFIQYQNITWLAETLSFFIALKETHQVSDDQIQWLKQQKIIESVANFGKPTLRFGLSLCAASLTCSEKMQKIFELFSYKPFKDKKNWQKLTCILSTELAFQGINPNIFTAEGAFRSETEKPTSCFNKKENTQALIEMLITLVRDTNLSASEKEQLLVRIVSEVPGGTAITIRELQAAYLQNIQAIISIYDFNEVPQIRDRSKSLVAISEGILKEKLLYGDVKVKDFISKYNEKFRAIRNPSAIITYASRIHFLNDKPAAACLGTYIVSTLNGTFKEDRYNISNSLHLKTLSEFNEKLLETWQKNQSINLDAIEFDDQLASHVKLTAKEWMKQQLGQNHLPEMRTLNLEFLNAYLKETDTEALSENEEKLKTTQVISLKKQNEIKKDATMIQKMKDNNEGIKKLNLKLQTLETDKQNEIKRTGIQKEDLLKKFNSDLKQLIEKYPTLNQSLKENATHDEIMAAVAGCKEITEAPRQVEEGLLKLRMQLLCIQWAKGSDQVKVLSEELEKMDANLNKKEYELNIVKINSSLDKLKKSLMEIKSILVKPPFENPEFINDIQDKIDEKSEVKAPGNEFAIETDDPIDLLLCGTEASGSCQRVDGNPHLNKGLLGYLMNGQNKLLAIKSADGKIHARCLLRLLWDGDKPVLFMEQFYPEDIPPKQVIAIETLAREKAKMLGIPLTSLSGLGQGYGKPLISLGGPAPWESCDGAQKGITNGKYEIVGANLLK